MDRRLGMLIDLNKCTGCNACVIAYKQENDLPPKWGSMSSGISFIRVEGIVLGEEYPDLSIYYTPILCMHCADPPCMEACPTDAIYKRTDGLVLINPDMCQGCGECLKFCPYNTICMDSELGIARKCSLCMRLIDKGHLPACASACNAGAFIFGDLADPKSKASKAIKGIKKDNYFVLNPEAKTRPSIYYIKTILDKS